MTRPRLLVMASASAAMTIGILGAWLDLTRAAPQGAGDAGIEGRVEIRPVRSVQRAGDANSAPYQATVTVLDGHGNTITTFTSDDQGHFRVVLPPGTYTLRPESPGRYPRASAQSVVVAPRTFTHVDIVYDSGRR